VAGAGSDAWRRVTFNHDSLSRGEGEWASTALSSSQSKHLSAFGVEKQLMDSALAFYYSARLFLEGTPHIQCQMSAAAIF
jgi:hypothetical protein